MKTKRTVYFTPMAARQQIVIVVGEDEITGDVKAYLNSCSDTMSEEEMEKEVKEKGAKLTRDQVIDLAIDFGIITSNH